VGLIYLKNKSYAQIIAIFSHKESIRCNALNIAIP